MLRAVVGFCLLLQYSPILGKERSCSQKSEIGLLLDIINLYLAKTVYVYKCQQK